MQDLKANTKEEYLTKLTEEDFEFNHSRSDSASDIGVIFLPYRLAGEYGEAYYLPTTPPTLITQTEIEMMIVSGREYLWSGPLGEYLLPPEEAALYFWGIVHHPQAEHDNLSNWVALEIAEQREIKKYGKRVDGWERKEIEDKWNEPAEDKAECPCICCVPPPKQSTSKFRENFSVEIRISVYRHYFELDPSNAQHVVKHREYRSLFKSKHTSLALLRTCRQVYNEITPILYGCNNIVFWPTELYDLPKLATSLFPALPSETQSGNMVQSAIYATDVVFCRNENGNCTQHEHSVFERESPTLSFLKMVGRELAALITNVSLMVRFPLCGYDPPDGGLYVRKDCPCWLAREDHDFVSSSIELVITIPILAKACPNIESLTLIMRGWDQKKHFEHLGFDEFSEEERQECIKHNLANVCSLMPGLRKLVLQTDFEPETDPEYINDTNKKEGWLGWGQEGVDFTTLVANRPKPSPDCIDSLMTHQAPWGPNPVCNKLWELWEEEDSDDDQYRAFVARKEGGENLEEEDEEQVDKGEEDIVDDDDENNNNNERRWVLFGQ